MARLLVALLEGPRATPSLIVVAITRSSSRPPAYVIAGILSKSVKKLLCEDVAFLQVVRMTKTYPGGIRCIYGICTQNSDKGWRYLLISTPLDILSKGSVHLHGHVWSFVQLVKSICMLY